MKLPLRTLAISLTAIAAACGSSNPVPGAAATEAAAPTAPPPMAAPSAVLKPSGAVIIKNYDCKPAMTLTVTYDNTDPGDPEAKLALGGKEYDLDLVPAASGARYYTDDGRSAGMTLVWWNKGKDGLLLEGRKGDPSTANETTIATCTERG